MGLGQDTVNSPNELKKQELDPGDESIGAIFGNISTTQFRFAITTANEHVKRTGYVQVWHDRHGWVLGQIMEINLESKITYSRAQQIARTNEEYSDIIDETNYTYMLDEQYHETTVKGMGTDKSKGKLAGLVNVLGYRDKHGIISLPSAPFAAGQRVFSAKPELIRSVLGLEIPESIGAYIGLLRNHDLKVRLNINELVQKHVSVIAKTGSGKSYIVGILIEELLKRKIPVIVLDPHGEYSGLMHPNIDENDTRLMSRFDIKPQGYSDAVHEYSLNPQINSGTLPLTLPSYGLSPDAISELLGLRGTGVQTAILFKAINRLMSKRSYFTLRELMHVIELDRNSAKWHLINNLENLISIGIFSDRPTRLRELVQPGRVTVINLRGIPPTQQQVAVTHLTRQLFEARKLNRIPAMMLVVEESHQFCPQQGSSRAANILKTIASEGRKFGLGMTLVTQRPAMVDKNVLSQCNTQIILKVTNPNDLKALVASVEGLNASMVDEIQRLPISVAVLIGAGIQMPVFVDVRVRETKHGGRPVDIFSNVETFYANHPQTEHAEQPEYGVYGYATSQDNDGEKDKGGEPIKAELNTSGIFAEELGETGTDKMSLTELLQSFNKKNKTSDDFINRMEEKFKSFNNSRTNSRKGNHDKELEEDIYKDKDE